jgi:copper(I)-binding protein
MLHNSVKHGDTMEMTAVDKVEIPAHGSVDFKPGAHHIMLMQPRHDIHPGDHVPVTLEFADGARLKVDFEVRKSDAPAGAPGSDTMKGMDSMQGMGDMPGMDMHGAHQP